MNVSLKEQADNLIRIYTQVNKDYKWKNSSNMNNLIALSHVMKEKAYSKEAIDRVNSYIKKNTGAFSCYRQKSVLFSALLVLDFADPETHFNILLNYEKRLKEYGFRSYTYRPVTAYTLLLTCEEEKIDERIGKAYEIFSKMRKNHPWLTSGDDYPLSILLAASDKSLQNIMDQIESLYDALHRVGFSRGNGLQFLSHILSLTPESDRDKALRCKELYDFYKARKLKIYSANYGSLGLLTLLSESSREAAEEVAEASRYLRENRGMRWLGKETVFLTAASLVSAKQIKNMKENSGILETNALITVESLIAAQTAAMLGATCAAAAAASSSG